MAEGSNQEKTETATPRQRAKAREMGRVVRSREVVSAAVFLGMILYLTFAGASLSRHMVALTTDTFARLDETAGSVSAFHQLMTHYLRRIAWMLLPLLGTMCVVALGANLLQTGLLFAPKALKPDMSRLSPLQGLKRIFSAQAFNELGKSLLKIGIVGYIVYSTIVNDLSQVFPLTTQEIIDIVSYVGQSALRLSVRASYAIIIMAILDYVFQRWQYEKSLRMTRRQVQDEKKQQEGDPHIRARIRSIMREMARRRMMEDVPKADVVITNPTHVAVALSYRRQDMPAPKVLAKGAGYIAERLKAVAQEHRIPLVENKPVAQRLFKTVEIGAYIPTALYQAVAEILAYVYRIRPPVRV